MHGDGKQYAHDAVIDLDARKAADAHRQREGGKEREGEADDFALFAAENALFERVQRVDDERGERERDEDIALQFSFGKAHDGARDKSQSEDEQEAAQLVLGVKAALREREGEQRHGDPADNAQKDHIGEQNHPDMVDEHGNTSDDLELIAADPSAIDRPVRHVRGPRQRMKLV